MYCAPIFVEENCCSWHTRNLGALGTSKFYNIWLDNWHFRKEGETMTWNVNNGNDGTTWTTEMTWTWTTEMTETWTTEMTKRKQLADKACCGLHWALLAGKCYFMKSEIIEFNLLDSVYLQSPSKKLRETRGLKTRTFNCNGRTVFQSKTIAHGAQFMTDYTIIYIFRFTDLCIWMKLFFYT